MREQMEQRSVLAETTHPEQAERASKYRWMQHFFTADVSPDNRPIIELQRRATWVGLACILQALNEIDQRLYMPFVYQFLPFMKHWWMLIPFTLILGSIIAMWQAFRPTSLKKQAQHLHGHPHRWQRIILVCALLTSIAGGIEFGRAVVMVFLPPQYTNDGTSLDTNAAALLLQGRNPYTDSDIVHLVRKFPIQPNWTTPLREGQFANRLNYPNMTELRSVLDTDLKAGHAPEFESKVSYPALSFLTLVPFVWLNIYNTLPFYLLSYLVLIGIAWRVVRPELRPWVPLLALANVSMWTSVVGGNLDVFYILLIVLAWLLRERTWSSAILLGLALASKQPSWLFIPFYAIMIWRHFSFAEAIRRLTIAGGLALLINLPFILWNPQAWLAGILAPVADPMFPMGIGIISLSSSPLMPTLPTLFYDIAEVSVLLVCLVWYWRLCKVRPEAVMVLAFLPLFFAWRSLPSYFYCSALPLFILLAAKALPARSRQPQKLSDSIFHIPFEYDGQLVGQRPAPAGAGMALRTMQEVQMLALLPRFTTMNHWHNAPLAWFENQDVFGKGQEA